MKLEHCYFLGKELELSFSQTTLAGRNQEVSSLLADLNNHEILKTRCELPLIEPIFHPYFAENLQRETKRFQNKQYDQDAGNLQAFELKPYILKKLNKRPLSPSYIDDFAQCPWRFFARWQLNLQDEIEEDLEIEARRRGQWAHQLLEKIFKHLGESFFNKNEIPNTQQAESIFDECASEFKKEIIEAEKAGAVPLPVLQKQLDKIIQQAQQLLELELKDWQGAKQKLFPRYLEWSFGRDQDQPYFVSFEDGLSIPVAGIVDRIDVSESGEFLVIDYKSSNSSSLSKRLRERRSFQLYIYLEAAQKILFKGRKALGGLYWDLKEIKKNQGMAIKELYQVYSKQNLRTQSFLSEENYQQLHQDLEAELKKILHRIINGDYSLVPQECLNESCHFNEICRYPDKKNSEA